MFIIMCFAYGLLVVEWFVLILVYSGINRYVFLCQKGLSLSNEKHVLIQEVLMVKKK